MTEIFSFVLGSVEFSANNLYQFYHTLDDVDTDIVTFVIKSRQQHMSNLHKELGDLAQIELTFDSDTSVYTVKLKPLLTPVSIPSAYQLDYRVKIFLQELYSTCCTTK